MEITTRLLGSLLVLFVLGCFGCEARTIARLVPEHAELQRRKVPIKTPKLDVLFVIDNSGSMGGEQASLRENFPRFVEELRDKQGDLPSLHVGVITAEGGAGFGENCNDLSRAGKLRAEPNPIRCEADDGPTGDKPFLFHLEQSEGTFINNYHDDLAKTFGCIAELVKEPCGTEQPLEAISQALRRPENEDFFRRDAFLAVVIISDEDDCSRTLTSAENCPSCDRGCGIQEESCTKPADACEQERIACEAEEEACKQNRSCPYSDRRHLSPELLPFVSSTSDFRCVEEAVVCEQDLRDSIVDHDADTEQTITEKTGCRAKNAEEIQAANGLLTPYEDYAARLIAAKGAADKVIVAAIVGEGDTIAVHDENDRFSRVKFGTSRTCHQAIAGNRIRAFVNQFGNQSAEASICSGPVGEETSDIPDLSGALEVIGTLIDKRIRTACFTDAIDLEVATEEVETDCVVSVVGADGSTEILASCLDKTGEKDRCWIMERNLSRCTEGQIHLRLANIGLPADAAVEVECLLREQRATK